MTYYWITFALCLMPVAFANNEKEYCKLCDDHTMCRYRNVSDACENSKDAGVTHQEKEYILKIHNWYRRIIAKGLESRGLNGTHQPAASNMMKMVWDEELQRVAQRWADQCQFQHDSCRNDKRWRVGQNIYWNWRFPILKAVNWTAALQSWFDEVAIFDPEIVRSYEFHPETGHYTQIVWHDSAHIGCGRRSYGPNKIYVCNYGPTGNWLEEPLYKIGEACSACPKGTTCEDGLCATDDSDELNIDSEEYDNSTVSEFLEPPAPDATSFFMEPDQNTIEGTELPINLNLIDESDMDDDIKSEVEDLKKRIRDLVDKIAARKAEKLL